MAQRQVISSQFAEDPSMVSEPIPPPSKGRRFSLRQVLLSIAVISVVLAAIYNYRQARESARLRTENVNLIGEIEALKLEAELKQFESDLKVPIEAIIEYVPWGEVVKLRQRGLKKSGIEFYPQFASVYLKGASDFELPATEKKQFYCDASLDISVANGSYEQFWRNHAPRSCERLTYELTHDKPAGKYLREHPDVFRKRLRPLLLRLVQSPTPWTRSYACEALVVGGDRTEAVLEAIRGFLSEPKCDVDVQTAKGRTVVKQFSSEKQKWIELNKRYKLDLPVSERSRP